MLTSDYVAVGAMLASYVQNICANFVETVQDSEQAGAERSLWALSLRYLKETPPPVSNSLRTVKLAVI